MSKQQLQVIVPPVQLAPFDLNAPLGGYDLDSWNVSLYPEDLANMFRNEDLTFLLCSHAPKAHKDHAHFNFKQFLKLGVKTALTGRRFSTLNEVIDAAISIDEDLYDSKMADHRRVPELMRPGRQTVPSQKLQL